MRTVDSIILKLILTLDMLMTGMLQIGSLTENVLNTAFFFISHGVLCIRLEVTEKVRTCCHFIEKGDCCESLRQTPLTFTSFDVPAEQCFP